MPTTEKVLFAIVLLSIFAIAATFALAGTIL